MSPRKFKAICNITWDAIRRRPGAVVPAALSVALVTVVLVAFLSLSVGLDRSLARAARPNVALVLSGQASTELTSIVTPMALAGLQSAPGLDGDAGRMISPEAVTVVSLPVPTGPGRINITVRGTDESGARLRPNFNVIAGRQARKGTNEILVGADILGRHPDLALARSIALAGNRFLVVGVFQTGSGALDSEIWCDREVLRALINRAGGVQSVRVQLSPDGIVKLQAYLRSRPELGLKAIADSSYYAQQAAGSADLLTYLGWPLAVMIGIGAFVAALNTILSSTASRAREIATLRAIGFSGGDLLAATLMEGVAVALAGMALGLTLGWATFDGRIGSTLAASQGSISFAFEIDGVVIATCVAAALLIGLLGAALPAFQAAHSPIAAAIQRR